MPELSPTNCHSNPQNTHQKITTQKRLCDFCNESVALLYCRADSAKLCLSCDREVHSTNQLFTKHTRFQLCDICHASSALILCVTEHSVLCHNCDYEVHSLPRNSVNHDRRPLEGFTGCPSVSEISATLGLEDIDAKCTIVDDDQSENNKSFCGGLFSGLEEENDGFVDFFWDAPTMVSLDELIVSTDKHHNFQAMVVPPLPKDRNLSCGQHKHEMFHQLRKLAMSEPGMKPQARHHIVADEYEKDSTLQLNDEEHPTFQGNEASPYTWCNDTGENGNEVFLSIEDSVLNSGTHSGMCGSAHLTTDGWNSQYPIRNESLGLPPNVSTREINSADRDSAISRYKEKKRTRRFEKHIRYESRKLQADNRRRIKGRFAKVDNLKNKA